MIRYLIPFSKLVSLNAVVAASGLPCFFPFYHTVGYQNELPHINKLYDVFTPEHFEKEIDFLLKHFNPITPEELIAGEFKKPAMLLSFDDGFRGVREFAHEVLMRKGVPYILFVNPDFIDNKDVMYRCKQSLLINYLIQEGEHELLIHSPEIRLDNYTSDEEALSTLAEKVDFSYEQFLKSQRPYLTVQELRDLRSDGVYIGAHSMNHPLYELLDLQQQIDQTIRSIEWVRSALGSGLGLFSFPFTDHGVSAEFMNWLSSNDAIKLSFGSAKLKLNTYPGHYQRLCMEENNAGSEDFLKSEFAAFLLKRISSKARVKYS